MKGDFTMNDFTYSYPVKVYLGTDAAKKAVSQELRVPESHGQNRVSPVCFNGVFMKSYLMAKPMGSPVMRKFPCTPNTLLSDIPKARLPDRAPDCFLPPKL